jgi:hypothetical protein
MSVEIRALHPTGERPPIMFTADTIRDQVSDFLACVKLGCKFEQREVTDWVPYEVVPVPDEENHK